MQALSDWPKPPVAFEDLKKVQYILGDDAEDAFLGWVLVPRTWVQRPPSDREDGETPLATFPD